ncbi:MAG: hypothetical protein KDB60_11020 [Propionibacteriaceae bacterium]|nr:hypothetical protein [Propionibacteriaceae bacterium]
MAWDPFSKLASTAAQIVTDAWTAAWLSVWNAGLWVLRLVLSWMDAWLTPDLSADGPGHDLYQVTFWIAGVLVVVLLVVQLGIAAGRRDGRGLARAGVGLAQFAVLTGGWLAYTVAVTVAVGGLTRSVMEQLLGVTSWNSWQPWTGLDTKQISDAGLATVLGLLGLLMWIAAIGHLLVILARDAALMVLVATGPIAAAGLVTEGTRAWFWKAFRWFHAAVATPLLVVIVTGVGTKLVEGVAAGKTGSVEASVGTMLPGIVLICIAVISPVALFKLLAFVDPGTSSGASMRAGLQAAGGIQGLLRGKPDQASDDGTAAAASAGGQSAGETNADAATTSRVAGVMQHVSAGMAMSIGAVARIGAQGTALMTDMTNQEGVGHNTYQPDYQGGPSDNAARANREANADKPSTTDPPASTPGGAQPTGPDGPTIPTSGAPSVSGEAGPSGGAGTSGGAAGGAGGATAAEVAEVAVVAL